MKMSKVAKKIIESGNPWMGRRTYITGYYSLSELHNARVPEWCSLNTTHKAKDKYNKSRR